MANIINGYTYGYGNSNGNGYGPPIDFRDILEITFRRKWWIITTFTIVLAFNIYRAVKIPTYYQTSAVIEFVNNGNMVGGVVDSRTIDSMRGLFQQRITSASYVERIMRKTGLVTGKEDPKTYEKILNMVRGSIGLATVGINAMRISFTHTDPYLAKRMVDTLLSTYIEEDSSSRRQELATSIDFISAQLECYYEKLQEGEAKLRELRQKRVSSGEGVDTAESLKRLISMPGMYKYGTERMADLQFKLVELDTELAVLKEKRSMLEKEMAKTEYGKVITIQVESPTIIRLRKTLAEYETQLEDLLIKCKEKHPLVVELRKNIAILQTKIKEEMAKPPEGVQAMNTAWRELASKINEIDVKIEDINMKKREIMILINVYGKSYKGMSREDVELVQLIRNNKINERLTELLLNRLESLRITQQLEIASGYVPFRVLDEARIPQIPLRKKTNKILFMGLIMALVLSGSVAYGLELIDQSVRKEQEVAKILEILPLGSVPEFRMLKTYKTK